MKPTKATTMEYRRALALAEELVAALRDGCDRIEVAGSVRRRKEECGDLELVAIPRIQRQETLDLFGESRGVGEVNLLDERLRELFAGGTWGLDPDLRRNGPRYKRLRSTRDDIACDLFLTTDRGWGGALAVRTGPADFSHGLVTLALRQRKHVADGYLLHGHPKGWRVAGFRGPEEVPCARGALCPLLLPTCEEADFFAQLGLPWSEPWDRTADWLWAQAKRAALGHKEAR